MKKIIFSAVLLLSLPLYAVQDTDFSMSGAVLKEKRADAEIWTKEDGTVISIYAGRTEAVFPDKSRIIKYNDGRREVFSPKGEKITIDDAKGIREYKDAAGTKTIVFDGRTPFGERIDRVEKTVLKNPVAVRLIYLPERSDEILYPGLTEEKVDLEIQSFYDGLHDALRSRFINDAA
ncbi:MAG: hypothetical protein ACRCUT_00025, partial [Spirochaetota bacterium]